MCVLVAFVMPLEIQAENYLGPQEKSLGTHSKLNRSFHVVADEPQGFGLRMEGYIIGIEKTHREILRVPDLASDMHLKENPQGFSDKNRSEYAGVLDDGRRTFISHIVRAKLDDDMPIPYIKNEFLMDAYCMGCSDERRPSRPAWTLDPNKHYENSWKSLENLKTELAGQLREAAEDGQPYTHVIIGTMGWNTAQEKAIRNLNSIFGNILTSQKDHHKGQFKPLYIAVTWPSKWRIPGISLRNKANDADEIGFVWVNALMNDHLADLREDSSEESWPAFKIVAIGHSLGARLVSRAAFSGAALDDEKDLARGADLIIGLQGAFSMNRFLKERESGKEGAPYADYRNLRGRIALTWSENDSATPIANRISGANYAGAKEGYERATDPRYSSHFEFLEVSESGDLDLAPIVEKQGKEIIYIDASELVRFNVLGTGGTAHSDIYNAYVGKMLASLINEL